MAQVKSLKLQPGTRIGSYRIEKPLGRGYEGEVYSAHEVPTEAKRAVKLIAREDLKSAREVIHTAWFFEQLAKTGSVARYFHLGEWFLDDNEGLFFLVFEHMEGSILPEFVAEQRKHGGFEARNAIRLVQRVAAAIERVHRLGFAAGDFETGSNLIVAGDAGDPRPVFCDLNPGKPDHPNVDFRNDATELVTLSELIFEGLEKSAAVERVRKALGRAAKTPKSKTTFAGLVEELRAL